MSRAEPLLPRLDPAMKEGVNLYGRYSLETKKTKKVCILYRHACNATSNLTKLYTFQGDDRYYLKYVWIPGSTRVAGTYYYPKSKSSIVIICIPFPMFILAQATDHISTTTQMVAATTILGTVEGGTRLHYQNTSRLRTKL